MHDIQVRGQDPSLDLPEPVLASIAGYCERVTTAARPMNRLISLTMLATVVAVVVEVARGLEPMWIPWSTLVLVIVPVGLAGRRTVSAAVRLGARQDDTTGQTRLARAVYRDHVVCLACIAAVLVVQLASAAR